MRDERRAVPPLLYPNFPRRLKALTLDSMVFVVFSALLFALVFLFKRVDAVRFALVMLWWFAFLFYEPLLVWTFGGTLGHAAMNLHVVDNRTEGNVSLVKAITRFWVKALLGIFSFLIMNLNRRHQAAHDILTNSSVRIKNPAKARVGQYIAGRR